MLADIHKNIAEVGLNSFSLIKFEIDAVSHN